MELSPIASSFLHALVSKMSINNNVYVKICLQVYYNEIFDTGLIRM